MNSNIPHFNGLKLDGSAIPVAVCCSSQAVSGTIGENVQLALATGTIQVGVPLHGADVAVVLHTIPIDGTYWFSFCSDQK